MRMNVFEMEGFLRGKCVPRDLKVNETNAEYLVRKFDALEAKCAALENKIIPVSAELPPANESVLLFDANGEGWLIGWRSLWYTWGQKETGRRHFAENTRRRLLIDTIKPIEVKHV